MKFPINPKKILQAPNPVLYKVSEPVTEVDTYIKELAQYMKSVLTRVLGIAAVQFGEPVRMIGVRRDTLSDLIIVNPEIVKVSDKTVASKEACLSVNMGQTQVSLRRHKRVKVVGYTLEGGRIVIKAQGLLSCVLQHEIDHLDGVLITANRKGGSDGTG